MYRPQGALVGASLGTSGCLDVLHGRSAVRQVSFQVPHGLRKNIRAGISSRGSLRHYRSSIDLPAAPASVEAFKKPRPDALSARFPAFSPPS